MTFMESVSSFFVVAVQGCVITNTVLGHVQGLIQTVKSSLLVQLQSPVPAGRLQGYRFGFDPDFLYFYTSVNEYSPVWSV